MARTTYEQPASEEAQRLVAAIFGLGGIGYVALCCGQEILLRSAPGLATETTPESNFYEELLVNPALLKLASQRGGLDCGGLNYVAIGYGGFVQLIMPITEGHVSMGLSRKANIHEMASRVASVVKEHGRDWKPPSPWLLA